MKELSEQILHYVPYVLLCMTEHLLSSGFMSWFFRPEEKIFRLSFKKRTECEDIQG